MNTYLSKKKIKNYQGGDISCEIVNIYSQLKAREMSDNNLSIEYKKNWENKSKTFNPVNNTVSQKLRTPTTNTNDV